MVVTVPEGAIEASERTFFLASATQLCYPARRNRKPHTALMPVAKDRNAPLPPDIHRQIAELVQRFHDGHPNYLASSYNEAQLRIEFLNPLFALLGWDVDNMAGRPAFSREVVHEASVLVDEGAETRKKHPDYEFRAGGERLFFVEAKKPSVDIRNDPAPAFQLRRYGWSGNLRFSVLTNFEWTSVYDCTIVPAEGDPAGTALLARFHYTDYETKIEDSTTFTTAERQHGQAVFEYLFET